MKIKFDITEVLSEGLFEPKTQKEIKIKRGLKDRAKDSNSIQTFINNFKERAVKADIDITVIEEYDNFDELVGDIKSFIDLWEKTPFKDIRSSELSINLEENRLSGQEEFNKLLSLYKKLEKTDHFRCVFIYAKKSDFSAAKYDGYLEWLTAKTLPSKQAQIKYNRPDYKEDFRQILQEGKNSYDSSKGLLSGIHVDNGFEYGLLDHIRNNKFGYSIAQMELPGNKFLLDVNIDNPGTLTQQGFKAIIDDIVKVKDMKSDSKRLYIDFNGYDLKKKYKQYTELIYLSNVLSGETDFNNIIRIGLGQDYDSLKPIDGVTYQSAELKIERGIGEPKQEQKEFKEDLHKLEIIDNSNGYKIIPVELRNNGLLLKVEKSMESEISENTLESIIDDIEGIDIENRVSIKIDFAGFKLNSDTDTDSNYKKFSELVYLSNTLKERGWQKINIDVSSIGFAQSDYRDFSLDGIVIKKDEHVESYAELIATWMRMLMVLNTGLHAVRTILAGVKTYQDPNMDNGLRLFADVVKAFAIGMHYRFKRHTMLGKFMMFAPVVYEFYKIIKYQISNESSEDTSWVHWFEVIILPILSNLVMTEIPSWFVTNSRSQFVAECVFTAANTFSTVGELLPYLENGLQISESDIVVRNNIVLPVIESKNITNKTIQATQINGEAVICDVQEDGVCMKKIGKGIDRDGVEKVNLCNVNGDFDDDLPGISNITKLYYLCFGNDNDIENGCRYKSESFAENGEKIIGITYDFFNESGNCPEIGEQVAGLV